MEKNIFAVAKGFASKAVYYPSVRPGYTAWASLFSFGNGDLGIAFNEIMRGENRNFHPPSLEFVESMALPYRMSADIYPLANPKIVWEYVCLKSTDGGKNWFETGRCPVYTRHYWHVGFPVSYPAYLRWGTLMITPETAKCFPDLFDVVKHFDVPNPDATIDKWIEAAGSEERVKEILDFLIENHIISKDENDVYHWYRGCLSGGEGEGWIHKVEVCEIEEYCI